MSENDVIVSSPEKKEKKDKKDKKKDKDKKKKKDKKKIDALGDSVDSLSLKSSDDYDDEKFKPVRNPAFNPALVSPLTSPATSRTSIISDSNGSNSDEKWTISSKSKDMPLIQTNTGANAATAEKSPLTPAELQGYAAQKFVPTNSYAHLDPSKSENAYAAFNHLQKVIMANKDSATKANQPPKSDAAASSQQQQNQPQQPQQQPPRAQAQAQPLQQQTRSVAQQSPLARLSPPTKQALPPKQSPSTTKQQPQQQHRQPQQRPPQPQQQQQSSNPKPRTERLADGAPALQYVRALWNYTAQVNITITVVVQDHEIIMTKFGCRSLPNCHLMQMIALPFSISNPTDGGMLSCSIQTEKREAWFLATT